MLEVISIWGYLANVFQNVSRCVWGLSRSHLCTTMTGNWALLTRTSGKFSLNKSCSTITPTNGNVGIVISSITQNLGFVSCEMISVLFLCSPIRCMTRCVGRLWQEVGRPLCSPYLSYCTQHQRRGEEFATLMRGMTHLWQEVIYSAMKEREGASCRRKKVGNTWGRQGPADSLTSGVVKRHRFSRELRRVYGNSGR